LIVLVAVDVGVTHVVPSIANALLGYALAQAARSST
jgi:hypothetical protein